jgi:hypothetical protein
MRRPDMVLVVPGCLLSRGGGRGRMHKIQSLVTFPIEGLDLSEFVGGAAMTPPLTPDLCFARQNQPPRDTRGAVCSLRVYGCGWR